MIVTVFFSVSNFLQKIIGSIFDANTISSSNFAFWFSQERDRDRDRDRDSDRERERERVSKKV